jgi:hypothetical protein
MMRATAMPTLLAAWLCVHLADAGGSPLRLEPEPVRFEAVAVHVDCGDAPLAAYQLDLRVRGAKIVGIEGGEHAVFAAPPYYDPAAMQGERIVIADFTTAPVETLPTGRTRIATIHVMVEGADDVEFEAELAVCATADGTPIPAKPVLQTGADR